MLIQSEIQTLPGEPFRFQSNEPLLLDDPQTVWVLQSGTLALFAISVQHGLPEGKRRYLFSVKAGAVLFSATPTDRFHLLAVSLEAAVVRRVSRAAFSEAIVTQNREAIDSLEDWIHQLGATLSEIKPPVSANPPEGNRYFSFAQGEIFQPEVITWVRVQQGQAQWLGAETLTAASGVVPLAAGMWLEAETPIEVESLRTTEMQDPETLLDGLSRLQTGVLSRVDWLEQQEMQQEVLRIDQRERLDQRAIEETLGELASVLQAQPMPLLPEADSHDPEEALLSAVGAIGRSLGMTIRPPTQSEDLKRLRDPLEAIARASRIRMRQITLREGWWQTNNGAMLAYRLEDYRPVALLPISETRYEIFDPTTQTRLPVDSTRAATLASTAYLFYRSFPASLKAFSLLQFALRGHFKEFTIVLLSGIAVTLLGMLIPQATAILIDNAIPDANRKVLVQIALGLLATALGSLLFQLTQGFAILRLETFADSATQAAVWDRLLNLKAAFFRHYAIGDLNSRVSAISQIRQKLSGTVLNSIFSSLFSLLNLGLLFYYNAQLAMIACVVALINIAITITSSLLMLRKVYPLLEVQGQIFGVMVQLINGVAKLRVAGAEPRAFAHWGKHYSRQLKLTLSTQGIEDCLTMINQILPALTTAVLFWFATDLLHPSQTQASLSTGTFLAFNAAFGTFISGATRLSNTVTDVLQVLPLWKRAEPILQAIPEVDASKTDPGRLSGKLVVDHVVFRYRNDGPLTLDEVSIEAKPGEFIALVGASGSGKSTLLRLLLGFEVPESGAVYYDGQDLTGLDIHAVRRQLGVVLQGSRLTSASIFENIASGALITMEEAWDAARLAGLATDIEAMPMGMHTVVSEGATNLSGGQRQRLLIAQALALKPQILLFDEATSALDNRTQATVSASLERLRVTRVVIAHRLSTIQHADRIYVLQNGRIVQQGTFEQLTHQEGLFAQLMQRQKL